MISVYAGDDYGYTMHKAWKDTTSGMSDADRDAIVKLDGYRDSVSMILDEGESMSLFDDHKVVVIYNAQFLSSGGKRSSLKASEGEAKHFAEYCKDPNEDTDMVFIVPGKLDQTNEMVKGLKNSSYVRIVSCDLPTEDDYLMLANKIAKERGKTIEKKAAAILYDRTQGDYLAFVNTLDKLLTYSSSVSEKDADRLVYKPLEDNIFEIITDLLNYRSAQALRVYEDLRKSGSEPLELIPVFASQLSFMACVRYLVKSGMDNNEIAQELSIGGKKISPGRIYHSKQDSQNVSFQTLLKALDELSEIERDIKVNGDDPDVRLKLFLSLFRKKYLY